MTAKIPRVQAAIIRELLKSGRLTDDQHSQIQASGEDFSGRNLDRLLIEKFKVSPFNLLIAKAKAVEVPPINARNLIVNERSFEKLDRTFCEEHKVLPVGSFGEHIVIATADPFNTAAFNLIQQKTHLQVFILLALEEDLAKKLESKKEGPVPVGFSDVMESLNVEFEGDASELDEEDVDLEEESSPIVQLASRIIEEAYYSGASDIHIEPFEKDARIRIRIDGLCQEKLRVPNKVCRSLIARIKVMSNLDIAEKRLPQDGRIIYKQFNKKGIDVDLRVSTAPLNHGEGAVMRILDKQKSTLPLPALGFSQENLSKYRDLIRRPYGMILHCGPTGSGKSMTLYSALNEINDPGKCIRTAEDPIEYTLNGLCQVQMHRQIGLTFASALRAFLRQDPDIILVGEIRDHETAQIAVEAALTGHMLFSTLHTNDAPSTISRLTEMGIEPFMISASLVCVCAQRLLRRVCKTCATKVVAEGREAEIIARAIDWNGEIYRPNLEGCPACNGIGYKGRVGVHELMATSEDLIHGINSGMETAKIKRIAIRNGMKTLHQDSILKVREQLTTLEEALATIPPDLEDTRKIIAATTTAEALEVR